LTTSDGQRNRSRERRVDFYAIDVSFDAIQNTDEKLYWQNLRNQLRTSGLIGQWQALKLSANDRSDRACLPSRRLTHWRDARRRKEQVPQGVSA